MTVTRFSIKKPVVLMYPPLEQAFDEYEDLEKSYNAVVLKIDAKNRQELIHDLKNKYKDYTINIVATSGPLYHHYGKFDREIIDLLPDLKAVCHNGAGYDPVDIDYLVQKNIPLSNVVGINDASTADTNLFLILATMRNYFLGNKNIKANKWRSGLPIGNNPKDKTLGILGMGGIGKDVNRRCKVLGFEKIIYYRRNQLPSEEEEGAEFVSLDQLLAQSDIISINLPLNASTHHFLDREQFEKMKDGVILVNTARGAVVNEVSLMEYLKNGKVKSYGSDVWENEPWHINEELIKMENVVATPHMGTWAKEVIYDYEAFQVKNIKHFIQHGKVLTIVPEQQQNF
ncbi:D-mandelate dehydrogenase-like dehydrogenase ASCRUDRAFT_6000 [Ascoidea rubescens DSM 1968]|uniref:Glyoxylate reductase n=1 Tax=Ascoidea rubescens DSM 1968 TaxID=1344418 RepID=A0A1D2VRC2_9ASCO|nr:hypothetical protein ASCRUDRAFT_6000 [Ascoidea rubescens DSM 1968]ODV64128.1 hypothetical protein ASCRUDRAFT_6000 [Ascoidea rubescens DSM 1968]